MRGARPKARRRGLLVRDLGGEVVVYELESHRGHCLNRTAALVWRACDGRKSVAGIAAHVAREAGVPVDEDLVRYALRRLRDARLLDPATPEAATPTRRELARHIGQLALLPVVVSLVAPKPAEAATCAATCLCDCSGQANWTSCSKDGLTGPGSFCCDGTCIGPVPYQCPPI